MPIVRLTRVVPFAAAHRYFRPEWPPERNRDAFGACTSEHGHGHNYECHVTVSGSMDADTGMVMNLRDVDTILREEVTQRLDHRYINYDVPEFAPGRQIPTGEALAVYLWERIAPRLPETVRLVRVRVQEDRYLYAEYAGEEHAG
ncbi:MAG: 6-carboxytetrahydropterin synthase [Gemmatimonadales bacterium]|nr:6-carboxytetrahydropterin synthase [Gemmatimonadales bacterium]